MNLTYDNIVKKTKNIVSECKLDGHEGCTATSVWDSRVGLYLSICRDWKAFLECFQGPSITIPTELLVLLVGIKGNLSTSSLLHRKPDLDVLVTQLFSSLMTMHHVDSIRLLLLQCTENEGTNLVYASQILKFCIVRIARDSHGKGEDCLGYLPLFRDALIWMVFELDYPELAGEEFISVLQPLGLRLTEDYRPFIQIAGLRVLKAMASKARISDWRQSCRAEAVISQLTEFRIGCGPHCSEDLLDEVYQTILKLICLLSHDTASKWYEKITERLLQDLLMESRRTKQLILLKYLCHLIDLLKSSFALHSCRFVRILSTVLLGPRNPIHKSLTESANQSIEDQVYSLLLKCLYEFITFSWPILVPGLVFDLIGPLVAFVDLYNSPVADSSPNLRTESIVNRNSEIIPKQLTDLFSLFIKLDPLLLSDVLIPTCKIVPSLIKYLPN